MSRESLRLTAPGSPDRFQSPTDSRHGNCRVCRLGRLSAFAAAGRGEPHSLQPTIPEPASSKSAPSSDSSAHRRSPGDSRVGRKRGAAIVGARRTGCADDQIHIMGVATLSRGLPFRRWLQPDAGFTRGLQPSLSDRAVGRRGALIFQCVRATLPAQSPAVAAGRAWRSTQ